MNLEIEKLEARARRGTPANDFQGQSSLLSDVHKGAPSIEFGNDGPNATGTIIFQLVTRNRRISRQATLRDHADWLVNKNKRCRALCGGG